MKRQSANYRILIEKERQPDGSEVFVSFVPLLGISDCGQTVEETVSNTQEAIEVYVESLLAHDQPVPASSDSFFLVTESNVSFQAV